jgi:phage host-nuclease inhibitor protein Gam
MARKRMAEPQLKSWEAVDAALASIADLQRGVELEQAACNELVDQIKQDGKERIKPMADEIKALELSIKEFCDYRKDEFIHIKTKKLVYGSVGYRLSTSVSIADPLFTLEQLRQRGLDHCIRIKEECDKDAIKQLDGSVIAEIGASLTSRNSFGFELAKVNPAA